MKDFFKNLSFVSECCNRSSVILDDDDDDDDIRVRRRILKLEKSYEKCLEHQTKLRKEIASLMGQLNKKTSSSSSSSGTSI